jgi:hypothetical protein
MPHNAEIWGHNPHFQQSTKKGEAALLKAAALFFAS